ncbi:MAG: hypothetical protein IJA85_06660 [Clostridia bacterium]|nr:hypothetical protein [Clostridia bacterium]
MKRLIAILMAVVLLTSCRVLERSEYGEIAAGDVTMETQFAVYGRDTEVIQVILRNNSGEVLEFGSAWSMEVLKGDAWMKLPFIANLGWNDLLYSVADGGSFSFKVHTASLADRLTDGRYRVVKKLGDSICAAEFEVGESKVSADSPYGFEALEALTADYSLVDAAEDGVITADGAESAVRMEQFFSMLKTRVNGQLRFGTEVDGKSVLTDLITEYELGEWRILYRVDKTRIGGDIDEAYYSSFVTDGKRIGLANRAEWNESEEMVILDWGASEAVIDSVKRMNEEMAMWSVRTAGFWSPDGMRLIMLNDKPLEFGSSKLYPEGGSSGSMQGLNDVPGMVAIRDVVWTSETEVMFVCECDTEGMTGYVFYDTETDKVMSYTVSAYAPQVEDGKIVIPE